MSVMKEFKEFAIKGNVVDLAVGVIIGAAFGKIVSSLVEDIVMPLVGALLGGLNFAALTLRVGEAIGVTARAQDIPSELTITADGAFWGSFGPTVRSGRLDTDLLLTRTVLPLSVPANALLGLLKGMPDGHDANLGIR